MLPFAGTRFGQSISNGVIVALCIITNAIVVDMARGDVPATSPTTAMVIDIKPLMADVKETNQKLSAVLAPGVLADPKRRSAAAADAIPLLKKIQADFDAVLTVKPSAKRQLAAGQVQAMAMLSTLGDKPSMDALQQMAASTDPQQAVRGQSGQLLARWYGTKDVAAQTAVVDDLEKLDRANSTSNELTMLTLNMSREAATPDLRNRMLAVATDEMTSPAATAEKRQLKFAADRRAAEEATIAKALDKPLTVAGTSPDGKPFTTADFKGKVVLVDFWATWCAPCRAELPRVKELYSKYHAQGLEVVGVSNDYDVEKLQQFVDQQQMPWPELFDADAAADNHWSRITLGLGIESIPRMFLIDREGIARSVTARSDTETTIKKLLADVTR